MPFTLSNTGVTITLGGDNEEFKKILGDRVKLGYDQVKRQLIITPKIDGWKLSPDRKGVKSYVSFHSKRMQALPHFGKLTLDKLTPIVGSKSYSFPIPEDNALPIPTPLKPHEKEFNGRIKGEKVIPEDNANESTPNIPSNVILMIEGEEMKFNVPSNELLKLMIGWIKSGYSTEN